jgi:hypothetical protein
MGGQLMRLYQRSLGLTRPPSPRRHPGESRDPFISGRDLRNRARLPMGPGFRRDDGGEREETKPTTVGIRLYISN